MENKVYGVVNPKKLDYFLATVFALVAVAAIWVAEWTLKTHVYEEVELCWQLVKKALCFDLADANYVAIFASSVVFYGGCLGSLVLLLGAIFKRRARVLPAVFATLVASFGAMIEIVFVILFANRLEFAISGVFATGIAMMLLVLLVVTYHGAKYAFKLVCCDEMYENYKNGKYCCGEECSCEECHCDEECHCECCAEPEEAQLKNKQKEITAISKKEEAFDAVLGESEEKAEKPKKAEAKKPAEKSASSAESIFGTGGNHFTFEQKLDMLKPVAREYFKEIKEYFEELGFKANRTKSAETFTYKNTKFAIITTAGLSGLKIYYKLSPADYEGSTIPVKDMSEKRKYEKTPLMFVVKSDLAVRRAKAFMDDIKKTLNDENI